VGTEDILAKTVAASKHMLQKGLKFFQRIAFKNLPVMLSPRFIPVEVEKIGKDLVHVKKDQLLIDDRKSH